MWTLFAQGLQQATHIHKKKKIHKKGVKYIQPMQPHIPLSHQSEHPTKTNAIGLNNQQTRPLHKAICQVC